MRKVFLSGGCHPTPRWGSAFFGAYTPGIDAFNALLEQWRSNGEMAGLELDRPDPEGTS
jgi:hypothetical protein